jgi:predicted esterase YcpF (UPF0227 family)
MSENEHKVINGNKNLIVCFGGMALQFGSIPPFEFLNYLSYNYTNHCDLIFYIDSHQSWYHNGIKGISNTVDETTLYLNKIIHKNNYEKIIFMGTSAGGYGAILFGSLCKNVNYVIGFFPQTILVNPINENYSNLKTIINKNTKYILYGDETIEDIDDNHHILQCQNIEHFPNVKIIKDHTFNLKELRDNGSIKKILDSIIYGYLIF